MKLDTLVNEIINEFGTDVDKAMSVQIVNTVVKAFPKKDIPDDKAETLMRVGRALQAMGVK